jgi:hypothetical protein
MAASTPRPLIASGATPIGSTGRAPDDDKVLGSIRGIFELLFNINKAKLSSLSSGGTRD